MKPTQDGEGMPPTEPIDFKTELTHLLNRHSVDNDCATPDFILAAYLLNCLTVWGNNTRARDKWWGFGKENKP